MDYLKMLSVILDPLSGPSWLLGLSFLIIVASTASKIFLFLQNLITSKQLKLSLWFWQILHCSIMWKNCTICRFCMFFNSDEQLSLRFSNILGIQVSWTLKLINDAISVEFIDLFFQWRIVSNFRCSESYFDINSNCFKIFCYISAEFFWNLFYIRNC